jgi:hypothetical protein
MDGTDHLLKQRAFPVFIVVFDRSLGEHETYAQHLL